MSQSWRINKSLRIVDAAIEQHLTDLCRIHGDFKFSQEKPQAAIRLFQLQFWLGSYHALEVEIKLRTLSTSRTELNITDLGWFKISQSFLGTSLAALSDTDRDLELQKFAPEDIQKTLELKDTVISEMLQGLKSDEIFAPTDFSRDMRGDLSEGIEDKQVRGKFVKASGSAKKANADPYVDLGRINELRLITSNQFDLSKLVRLCEELNKCYENGCFLAVAMLTRAILDHVPPILGYEKFGEVANNYSGGGKSFKQSMEHLENSSRKIADAHLHGQIRNKESLPNETQVNFSNDLDVLLGEIIRVLR